VTRVALLLSLGLAGVAAAQQSQPVDRLRALAARGDDGALLEAVRGRPDDARELVRRLLAYDAVAPAADADEALRLARRVAGEYARAWEDSFPLALVGRVERMSPGQRAARAAADSVGRAGNRALGRAGVDAALALWRQALRRSAAVADTAGVAAALGNIGAGFYQAGRLDSAGHYLGRARALAEVIGDRRTAVNALGALGSVAGMVLSVGAAWAIVHFIFKSPFTPSLSPLLAIAAGMIMLTVSIGVWGGRDVFAETPMAALREV
jgi:tetratricopeptide (TPR) repeat protein